jgi:predicted DNA-binding transcriptional regulator AlpA
VEKLLGPDDLADLIGVPAKTLADWRSRGLGPTYVRVGRHVRYRPAAVEAWLEAQVAGHGAA